MTSVFVQRYWLALGTSALLLWALNTSNPYGYYILLRIVVFTVFCLYTFRAFRVNPESAKPWICGGIALIYNPFFLLALGRPTWTVVNIITIIALFVLASKTPQESGSPENRNI